MQPTLIDQGLMLMLVGMGTVVIFLTILVAAMSLMAAIVARFLPIEDADEVSDENVAVITAALVQHRNQHS